MINSAHLRAMIVYESRMQWRRGGWRLTLFSFFALVLLSIALTRSILGEFDPLEAEQVVTTYLRSYSYDPTTGQNILLDERALDPRALLGDRLDTLTADDFARVNATIFAFYGLWFGQLILMFATPMFMAEIVPLDHQYHMRSLLNSTPLTTGTYLAGKVLSVMVNMLLLGCIGGLVVLLLTLLIYGPLHLGAYLTGFAAGFLPTSLFAGALGVLAASPAHTRRRSLLITLVILPVCGLAFAVALMDLWTLTLLAEPLLYFTAMGVHGLGSDALAQNAITSLAKGALLIAGIWVVAWLWQRQSATR